MSISSTLPSVSTKSQPAIPHRRRLLPEAEHDQPDPVDRPVHAESDQAHHLGVETPALQQRAKSIDFHASEPETQQPDQNRCGGTEPAGQGAVIVARITALRKEMERDRGETD
jgi:hypothetical protein